MLVATGRKPNVAGLGLNHTSLALDERGVPVYDPATLQAGAYPVFIAGDAIGILPLLHEAADEGRAAGTNAARFPDVAPLRRARRSRSRSPTPASRWSAPGTRISRRTRSSPAR